MKIFKILQLAFIVCFVWLNSFMNMRCKCSSLLQIQTTKAFDLLFNTLKLNMSSSFKVICVLGF